MVFARGMIIAGWVGVSISTALTIARLWIRAVKLRKLMWDDATHVAALLCFWAWVGMNVTFAPIIARLIDVQQGKKMFTADFLLVDVPQFFKYLYAFQALSYANLWLIKYSFLIFYKRFFRNLKGLTTAWWVVFVYVTITYLGTWACQLVIGITPHGAFELAKIGSAEGARRTKINTWVFCGLDLSTDLCILLLPMGLLWKLRIPWDQRVGLLGIFSIAIVTMAFCLVRAIMYNQQNKSSKTYGYSHSTNVDPAWLIFWALLESTAATCVSCMPTFRLLLMKPNVTTAQLADNSESYDADGLAKVKAGGRSPSDEGRNGGPAGAAAKKRPKYRVRQVSGSSTHSSFRQWLLRLSPNASKESFAPPSFVRFIWPGRGRLGNRGSLHGPLDSVSIPGGTLMSKAEPEKGEDLEAGRFGRGEGGLGRVDETHEHHQAPHAL